MNKEEHLKTLGSQNTVYEDSNPNAGMFETFENTAGDTLVPFVANEFTSLCPKTGQPDFAKVEVVYVPRSKCIESKSFKLYLFAFRNHGDFHEDCIAKIGNDIIETIRPRYLRVFGDFNVRGGISIKPLFEAWDVDNEGERRNVNSMIESYDRLRHWDN